MTLDSSGTAPPLHLALIGDNIRKSRAPALHRLCGDLTGIDVTYDLVIPAECGADFRASLEACRRAGMRGVNVTYPYKEEAVGLVRVPDADVARIGAINTIVFDPAGPLGFNTDYSGFIAAYRAKFDQQPAGAVALVGAGGVGRAIAFALLKLGVTELRLVDRDLPKARALANELSAIASPNQSILAEADVGTGLAAAGGVINATPIGMYGYPGTAIPADLLAGQRWAFDAVYTPMQTEFIKAADAAGLDVLSGYELFFYQGVHAFALFADTTPPDLETLRHRLRQTAAV